MKHIDITFDFETVSTAPDAAPMSLAAVVWNRNAEDLNPFTGDDFRKGIDLRTCVMEGFNFDQGTVEWWSKQNDDVKNSVIEDECYPVDTVILEFFEWVNEMKKKHQAETVCLWCQGQDFDFPILKTIIKKFDLKEGMPVHQHYFRDCRTMILETVMQLVSDEDAEEIMKKPSLAYNRIPRIPERIVEGKGGTHDPMYDCLRSSWNVWWCMRLLRNFENVEGPHAANC